jgi:hypothetical protein
MAARKRKQSKCRRRKPKVEVTPNSLEKCLEALIGLRDRMLTGFKLHGNAKWQPATVVLMAALWSWMPGNSLTNRFEDARNLLKEWSSRWILDSFFVGQSYQGFIAALNRYSAELSLAVVAEIRNDIRKTKVWRVAGMPVMAIDGTKVGVPWTKDTDRKLGRHATKKSRRRKKRKRWKKKVLSANSQAHQALRPQIMLTLVWNVGTGLPWAWKMGPVSTSEREQAQQLIATLPEGSLAVEDAGFTGYEFWQAMIQAGHHFVTRIGANVKVLKKLGWKVKIKNGGELAHLWPDAQRRQEEPPITIRLVKFQTARTTVVVATTILSRSELSDEQIADIYRMRWGIEGWFRSLKQTFERRTLLSKTAEHAQLELEWSIIGLSLMELHGIKALMDHGESPQQLSEAKAIRAVQSTVLQVDFTLEMLPTLILRLQSALIDQYDRKGTKHGRHVHRKKQTAPTGQPKIIDATPQQRLAARQLQAGKATA